MTDEATLDVPAKAATPTRDFTRRGARFSDIDFVHAKLMEVITESAFYSERFKAYEKARLTKDFLAGLIETDPDHVMLFERDGTIAAFMISGPELGTLWLYWSYVFPEHRRSSLGVGGMRAFLAHWDSGRFHKVSTYTKAGNDVAAAIMKRMGYKQTALLANHIFGEDYLLFERPLTKRTEGYDTGVAGGLKARLRRRIRRFIGR